MSDTRTNECPNCTNGTLTVYATRVDQAADMRVQYLKCKSCGHKPDSPRMVPLSAAPMQPRRRIVMRRIKQNRMF